VVLIAQSAHTSSPSASRCRTRVAPRSASTVSTCNASPHPLALSATAPQVTPRRRPSAAAGDGSSRRFEARILQRRFGVTRRVAPAFTHLPRLPLRSWVTPRPSRSGFAGDGPSRRFEGCTFGGADRTFPGCPVPRSFGIADDQFPGFPRTCVFRHQLMNFPSCPGSFTLRLRQRRFSGLPRIFVPLAPPTGLAPFRPGASVVRRC